MLHPAAATAASALYLLESRGAGVRLLFLGGFSWSVWSLFMCRIVFNNVLLHQCKSDDCFVFTAASSLDLTTRFVIYFLFDNKINKSDVGLVI